MRRMQHQTWYGKALFLCDPGELAKKGRRRRPAKKRSIRLRAFQSWYYALDTKSSPCLPSSLDEHESHDVVTHIDKKEEEAEAEKTEEEDKRGELLRRRRDSVEQELKNDLAPPSKRAAPSQTPQLILGQVKALVVDDVVCFTSHLNMLKKFSLTYTGHVTIFSSLNSRVKAAF